MGNAQLMFSGVCQCTAEVLAVSAEVAIDPADAVDGIFVLLGAALTAVVRVE
jgi:hypothetical protein